MRLKGVFMLKKLGTMLLVASIGALLSGCLVEKYKAEKKIARTTDTLRIYEAGDSIDYNVTAIISSGTNVTTQRGIMRITWNTPSTALIDPFDNPVPSVLKEITTLTYDGSTQPDVQVVRYISQATTAPVNAGDPGIGSVLLHAIDDSLNAHYWPYAPADVGTDPTAPVYTPVIFDSPLVLNTVPPNSPQRFSIMECDAGQCLGQDENYEYNNRFDVGTDTTEITTDLGIFSDPIYVDFSGGTQPTAGAPDFPLVGDILDACGDSTEIVTHSGNMYIAPEIGMIQMTNECTNITNSASRVFYTMSVRNTSFPFK